ncbi:MAG: hypothetical protein AC479_07465 [miscellaneous Crenarchaeota group-6 archaeon AD8-1]|nr:MAG: hypothetical protein AC479_07465 [miscellaneous Crenarchaeota group-6 archaeon AD8-1]
MVFNFLRSGITITPREFASVTLLTSGTLAWFFLIIYNADILFGFFDPSETSILIGQLIFFGIAVFSALLSSLIDKKENCRKFLIFWVIIGIMTTILLPFFQGIEMLIIFSVFLGFSIGFVLPDSFTMIADCTNIEERGRVAGFVILETFAFAFLGLGLIIFLGQGIFEVVLIMALLRSISLLALILEKCEVIASKNKPELLRSYYREFIFYIIPWIIFTLVAGLAQNAIPDDQAYEKVASIGNIIRYALIGIFGLIWGLLADRIGRKWPIIFGLIILGAGFFLIGFALNPNVYLIYLLLSGIAWGSFFTIYLVIPGDLSTPSSRIKFYALGTISPLMALFAISILGEYVPLFSTSAFSQVLSVLLFVSILPVLRAKETLEESKIRKRKMKEYTEKLGEIIRESKEEK